MIKSIHRERGMKDLFFATDLLTLFRHDKFYGVPKNLSVALRKLGLPSNESIANIEKMFHSMVVHIMDQKGESEPFLSEAFIYPEHSSGVTIELIEPYPTSRGYRPRRS